ncbi:unnamed protein product [Symbiodinium sp. CCMP2592]|nr:unnamed protein product [Symbiodinium sp. CCMP2592]
MSSTCHRRSRFTRWRPGTFVWKGLRDWMSGMLKLHSPQTRSLDPQFILLFKP